MISVKFTLDGRKLLEGDTSSEIPAGKMICVMFHEYDPRYNCQQCNNRNKWQQY